MRLQAEEAAAEIVKALSPLPDGFFVRVDDDTNGILIGCDALAFAITRHSIADGAALAEATTAYPQLLDALSLFYLEEASKFRTRNGADGTAIGIAASVHGA